MIKVLSASVLLFVASAGFAQTPTDFSGTWDVRWSENNLQLGAKVSIENETGNWQMYAQTRRNPCFPANAPIELKRIGENKASVTIKYSAVISGCADGILTIQKTDANSMTGMRRGAEMIFTRN